MTFWNDTLRRVGAACAITCTMLGAPAQSWAQGSEQAINSLVSSTVAVYVGLGTTALAVVALPFGLTTTAGGAATKEQGAALERYLNENRADVLASVSGGAGGAGEDLATMFGVSGGNRVRFVAALRADRQGLGDVLGQRDIDREGAEVFMGRVIDLMRADDALSADLPEKLLRI